jgi:hypothetical protein
VGELFFVWECEPAPVGELFLYGTARTGVKILGCKPIHIKKVLPPPQTG